MRVNRMPANRLACPRPSYSPRAALLSQHSKIERLTMGLHASFISTGKQANVICMPSSFQGICRFERIQVLSSPYIYQYGQCTDWINSQLKRTHQKPWKCPSCDRGFGLRSDRDRHVKHKHQIGHTKFSCIFEGCGFRAFRKDNLTQHMKRYHGALSQSSAPAEHSIAEVQQVINFSTLIREANTGRIDVLELCLMSGLDINLKSDDGFTALRCEARTGQVDTLSYLLCRGADANMYSSNGSPSLPTHEAVLGRSLDCFKLLLQEKAET